MTARKRILEYIDLKGITKYKFYKDVGLSNGYLDKEGNIGSDICEKISYQYDDLDLTWLITGKGSMLKSSLRVNSIEDIQDTPTDRAMSIYKLKTDYFNTEKQLIPLYEISGAAGLTTLFDNKHVQQIPLDYISIPNAPKCDGAVFVRGDSMYPVLKAGDIVCYKHIENLEDIYWGEMYLLDIDVAGDQYLTFKYVQKSDEGDEYVRLVSQNSHHSPKDIKKGDIRSIALVKVSIRYNTLS